MFRHFTPSIASLCFEWNCGYLYCSFQSGCPVLISYSRHHWNTSGQASDFLLPDPRLHIYSAIYMMSLRPSSPSAHFYTKRASSSATHQRTPEMDNSPSHVEPFEHFQGLSVHGTGQERMYQFGLHDYQIREEMISPRMPIPNPALLRASPHPQAPGLASNNENIVPRMHRHTLDQRGVGAVTSYDTHSYEPASRNSPIHYRSLPPLPKVISLFQPATIPPCPPPTPLCFAPTRQEGQGLPSAHPNNNISRTIHVPSVSELSSTSASAYEAHSMRSGDHNQNNGSGRSKGMDHIFGQNDGSAPAMFASSGITSSEAPQHGGKNSLAPTTISTSSFVSMTGKDLAGDVVEVHDVCLLVTQRYLDALRINWRLRHGREKGVSGTAAITGQRVAFRRTLKKTRRGPGDSGHRKAQKHNSPHSRLRGQSSSGRRRAFSADSYLAASESSWHGNQDGDGAGIEHRSNGQRCSRDNSPVPIPRPTDSLLQNIHYICELIWRRARRNRVDVLGAEARGCRDMQVLQECGETIVLYNVVDFERDPDACFERVLRAGRDICRELRDWEALRLMENWDEEGQEEDA